MNITFNQFTKTTYPYLDDTYIDNYIPVAYGKIASVKLTPVNSNYDTDNGDIAAVYRMPDGMTNYGTAYVEIDDTWVAATVESVDYDTGLITISNGRADSGSTYECKLTDCYGYMFDGHCYPRQALQHWYATYGGIQYTDSNFNKTEWETALDDSRYQADFGLLLDDYSKDEDSDNTYDLDYFNKIVYNIATFGGKMYCRVDYDLSGKITATLKDYDRTASDTIASADIYDNNTLSASTTAGSAYTSVIEKYYHNTVDDNYLSLEDNTYEKYVKQNYRIMQSLTDKSYLINETDAKTRAAELALEYKHIPVEFEINVRDRYTTRLYDVVTVALMPDNLDSSMRQYAGNKDCLVTGVAPLPDSGYTTLTVQIIPDRTASAQQASVRNSAYTTVARSKSSTQIITDNLQTQITDNLLLTGSLSLVSINLNATTSGVVSDFSKATGTFSVKYNGTDITGNGPVYAVVSQTGCTGTIDESTGVYAVSALSADVGILLLKATYEGQEIETSFTVTKAYTGATGADGTDSTAITISDPASTTPETGMKYSNTYYGIYSGVWYMWAWNSSTTGYWTQASADTPPVPAIRYSFDEMPDLPDDSGAIYKANYGKFTATTYWFAYNGVITLSNGFILNTVTSTGHDTIFDKSVSIASKIVKLSFKISSSATSAYLYYNNGSYVALKTFSTLSAGTVYTVSALIPSDATSTNLMLNINGSVSGAVVTVLEFYLGDGTTSQPIIDNISGTHNSIAQSGVVSTTGVSGKACQFLGYKAIALDLSAYAKVQSWWTSRWLHIGTVASTVNHRFWNLGSKEYAYKNSGTTESSSNVVTFVTYNGTNALGGDVAIPSGTHLIVVQTIITSSSSATKKVYVDGVLAGIFTSTADFTSLTFSSSGAIGGYTISSNVMVGWQDDFQFGVGEITASQALGLYLQRASAAKLYTLADYNYDNSVSSWEIVSSVSAFTKARSGVVSPSSVTLSAKAIISSTADAYSGRFIIYEDGTSVYTSSADESSHSYSPASGISSIRIELYKSGGTETLVATKEFAVSYAADVAPEYLGIGLLADVSGLTTKAYTSATIDDDGTITAGSSNSAVITGDWMINYTAGTYRALGIYYWSGTAWTITSDSKYTSDGVIEDICRLNNGGILIPDWTVYVNLIADNLFSHTIKLTTKTISGTTDAGVFYGGDRFNADGSIADRSKNGFYFKTDGTGWCNLQSDDKYNFYMGTDAGLELSSGSYGSNNFLAGYSSGKLLSVCNHNIGIGSYSLSSLVGFNNVASGTVSHYGFYNIGIGSYSLPDLVTGGGVYYSTDDGLTKYYGSYNIGIGKNALAGLTGGNFNFGVNASVYHPTWSYQMNLNNRIIYLEFASTATQNTVYQAITNYIGTTINLVIPCMGLFGAADKGIVLIYRESSTVLTLRNNNDNTKLTLKSGSSTNIGYSLQVCFIAFATPTNE